MLAGLVVWLLLTPLATAAAPKAHLLDLKGAVGPVSADYLERSLHQAAKEDAAVIVLLMDTPGGLDSSMREIVRAILASPVPVVGHVAPSALPAPGPLCLPDCRHGPGHQPRRGDSGQSFRRLLPGRAGAHQARLVGGEQAESDPPARCRDNQGHNDAVAYVRGLAKLNGRNADWAERAVREAASLPYDEALMQRIGD